LASLKAKIVDVRTDIYREVIICTCQKFWPRIEAVVEASGNFKK
jgi:hypothetical protein